MRAECGGSPPTVCAFAMFASSTSGIAASKDPAASVKTKSPIKHVIILIGENRGFDHTFGVYKPKGRGQTISNLLSKGIVDIDGNPGTNYSLSQQSSVSPQTSYYIGVKKSAKTPYSVATNLMPQPNTNGAPSAQSATGAPFATIAEASVEHDIEPQYLSLLTTGATAAGGNQVAGPNHLRCRCNSPLSSSRVMFVSSTIWKSNIPTQTKLAPFWNA